MSHLMVWSAVIRSGPSANGARGHFVTPGVVRGAVSVGALVLTGLSEHSESSGHVVVWRIGLRVQLWGLQDVIVDLHFQRRLGWEILIGQIKFFSYLEIKLLWTFRLILRKTRNLAGNKLFVKNYEILIFVY